MPTCECECTEVQYKGYNLFGVTTVDGGTTRGTIALVYLQLHSSLYTDAVQGWWSTPNWSDHRQGCMQVSTLTSKASGDLKNRFARVRKSTNNCLNGDCCQNSCWRYIFTGISIFYWHICICRSISSMYQHLKIYIFSILLQIYIWSVYPDLQIYICWTFLYFYGESLHKSTPQPVLETRK
jgi:hypothetical protein